MRLVTSVALRGALVLPIAILAACSLRNAARRTDLPEILVPSITPSAAPSSPMALVPAQQVSPVVAALSAFSSGVRPLSDPRALSSAFSSYFAYSSTHPEVKRPLLYFVDYGLPSTSPRGYVFDMVSLKIIDGPFMVAHGRGSSAARVGTPDRFSNSLGSAATSLGLYSVENLYRFHGHAGGRAYSSVGVRLKGLSTGFNDLAFARRVVAHGAPYVTDKGAGRSEGCPAMALDRAERLLPALAGGGMVFLFAPADAWLSQDPWLNHG